VSARGVIGLPARTGLALAVPIAAQPAVALAYGGIRLEY
jgi:hypothetical protein